MRTRNGWMGAGGVAAAIVLAMAVGSFAAEPATPGANLENWQRCAPQSSAADGGMSVAQIGKGGEAIYRGDECPVGSGSYCSDESPYCFLCKGDYACCWTNEVWRCCD